MGFEKLLIAHCSPTLASLKIANLFSYSFETEKELAGKLLDQVEKNGYTIAGDYLCETIVETPIFEKDERGMFLRLQVPVNVR